MTRAAGLCRETQDPGQVKHRLTSETCHPHAVKLPFCPCNKRRKKRTLTSLRRAGFQKLGLIVSWRLAKLHFSLASLINDVAHACDAATSPLITGCGVLKLERHSLLGPGTSIHWADARPAVRGLDIFERCADGPMDPKHKSCALATQLQHSPMSAHLRSGRRGAILSSPYPSHNALTSSTPRCRLQPPFHRAGQHREAAVFLRQRSSSTRLQNTQNYRNVRRPGCLQSSGTWHLAAVTDLA